MFRLYFITFEGSPRSKESKAAVEVTSLMVGPLIILAVLSVLGGYHQLFPFSIVGFVLDDLQSVAEMPNHLWMIVLGTFAWIAGSIAAKLVYSGSPSDDPLSERILHFLIFAAVSFSLMKFMVFHKRIKIHCSICGVMELLFISGLMWLEVLLDVLVVALLGKICYNSTYGFWVSERSDLSLMRLVFW